MSWKSAAASRARSSLPARSHMLTSPDGQPVVAIRPLPYRSSRSRSNRGLRYWPSRLASGEMRKRLCMPSVARASRARVGHAPRRRGEQRVLGVGGLAPVVPAVTLLVEELVAEVERRAVEARAGRV